MGIEMHPKPTHQHSKKLIYDVDGYAKLGGKLLVSYQSPAYMTWDSFPAMFYLGEKVRFVDFPFLILFFYFYFICVGI